MDKIMYRWLLCVIIMFCKKKKKNPIIVQHQRQMLKQFDNLTIILSDNFKDQQGNEQIWGWALKGEPRRWCNNLEFSLTNTYCACV